MLDNNYVMHFVRQSCNVWSHEDPLLTTFSTEACCRYSQWLQCNIL